MMNLLFTDAPKEPLARLKAIANSPTEVDPVSWTLGGQS